MILKLKIDKIKFVVQCLFTYPDLIYPDSFSPEDNSKNIQY